ncbi:MAG: c-type cytochrome [Nitrospirota bacterium]
MSRSTFARRVFGLAALSAALGMGAVDLRAQDGGADVNRGRAVYERHCLACHGVGGRGDGPEAASLRTKPANFHRAISMLKSDEELLRVIEYGVVFSPMHAWQGKLTEGELQDVLAYIRLLPQQSP